jgi:hypothetical protein
MEFKLIICISFLAPGDYIKKLQEAKRWRLALGISSRVVFEEPE